MVSDPAAVPFNASQLARLNPCSNGIWSLTIYLSSQPGFRSCLNPCSNGIWSLTIVSPGGSAAAGVLILVLMEYGL